MIKGLGYFMAEIHYGARALMKTPVFTCIAAITLALGIGGSTASFSVLNRLLLEPLPYPDSNRIMHLWSTDSKKSGEFPFSTPNYCDFRDQTTTFDSVACCSYGPGTLGGEPPMPISTVQCSSSLSRVYGFQMMLGRWFTENDEKENLDHLVVLSHGIWQTHFNSDPHIVDTLIKLDGEDYQVIGVLPPGGGYVRHGH